MQQVTTSTDRTSALGNNTTSHLRHPGFGGVPGDAWGTPYVYPDNELGYAANFMNMLWKMMEPKYTANPNLNGLSHGVHFDLEQQVVAANISGRKDHRQILQPVPPAVAFECARFLDFLEIRDPAGHIRPAHPA